MCPEVIGYTSMMFDGKNLGARVYVGEVYFASDFRMKK